MPRNKQIPPKTPAKRAYSRTQKPVSPEETQATEQELLFVEGIAAGKELSKAYTAAGYTTKSIYANASKLASKPHIKKLLDVVLERYKRGDMMRLAKSVRNLETVADETINPGDLRPADIIKANEILMKYDMPEDDKAAGSTTVNFTALIQIYNDFKNGTNGAPKVDLPDLEELHD